MMHSGISVEESAGGLAKDHQHGLPLVALSAFRTGPTNAGDWSWSVPCLVICCLSVLVLFRHTFLLMVETWYESRTYSHCFLIVPMFLWLVWARRDVIASLRPSPNYWGLP